jgi:hypothetical protein
MDVGKVGGKGTLWGGEGWVWGKSECGEGLNC